MLFPPFVSEVSSATSRIFVAVEAATTSGRCETEAHTPREVQSGSPALLVPAEPALTASATSAERTAAAVGPGLVRSITRC
jgi:hypothetical protein